MGVKVMQVEVLLLALFALLLHSVLEDLVLVLLLLPELLFHFDMQQVLSLPGLPSRRLSCWSSL